jgi:peptidoglycan/xylan/chitin deacetylase (PgdA/CDA1 family)
MLIAVNFHYIRKKFDDPYPSIFGVTPEEFSAQLDILGESAQFISARDICDIIDGKKRMPPRAVVITFDDGFREQYNLAWPILKKKDIPAIFFVNTRPIDEDFVTTVHKIHILRAYTPPERVLDILNSVLKRQGKSLVFPSIQTARIAYKYDSDENAQLKYFLNYVLNESTRKEVIDLCFKMLGFDEVSISKDLYMTKEMVADLANAGVLGTHGHEHVPFGLLDDSSAVEDFIRSIMLLQEWTNQPVLSLSYPYGSQGACSPVVARYALQTNVRFAFTLERAGNLCIDNPMFLGRFSSSDVPGGNNCTLGIEEFWKGIKYATWFS